MNPHLRTEEEYEVVTSAEFDSLLPEQKFDRRNFLVTSLAAGFAVAVQPVSGETITTDANGLVAGEVKIPVKDGEIPGYCAMPATGGPFATVLVADQGIPVDTVNKMRDALRAAKKPGDLIVYPDTPHAFNADYRPSYRKEAAEDGWKRLRSWFAVYGVV